MPAPPPNPQWSGQATDGLGTNEVFEGQQWGQYPPQDKGGAGTIQLVESTDGSVKVSGGAGPTVDLSVASGDPFSIMAAHAQSFGNGLTPPVDFSLFDPFVEDFPASSVSSILGPVPGPSVGTITFPTVTDNFGPFGRIKAKAGGVGGSDFAFACPAGNVGFIGDVTESTYYVEWKVRFKETAAGNSTAHAVGIVQATGALDPNSRFVIIGLIGDGAVIPTKLSIAMWNGNAPDYTVTPSTVNADVSGTVDHYLGLGHDSVAHMFHLIYDGVPILSVSDVVMGTNLGPGPYTALLYDQASANGFTDADKVYMVTAS